MNFPPTVYDALARREEYGHGVIHAVCRDFHLHTLRRLHTHLHRPGIIATGTITGEGKNI